MPRVETKARTSDHLSVPGRWKNTATEQLIREVAQRRVQPSTGSDCALSTVPRSRSYDEDPVWSELDLSQILQLIKWGMTRI